jgi:hypothetical protein
VNATRARAEIVTGFESHCLDASCQRRGAREEIDVSRPYRTLDDRSVTRVTDQIAQHRYAIQSEGTERVGDSRYRNERTKDPRCDTTHPPHWLWRFARRPGVRSLGDDEIRASLEAFDELGQMFRLIGEVGLHHDHGVSPGVSRSSRDLAAEPIERSCIANVLFGADDRQGEYIRVPLKRLPRSVGAGVVEDDDLVLAGIFLKDLANAPQ